MTSVITKERDTRYWELFADWCESMDVVPLPSTAAIVSDFLEAFPAPIETQGRRVKAIRRAHESAGTPLALPTAPTVPLWREGPEWASVPRALEQVRKYSHPKYRADAVRGRRDGWLIVLVGMLGLTRRQARELDEQDVAVFPRLTIKGVPIPKTEPAAECPACAVTRWLRVTADASHGFKREVERIVSPVGLVESVHDCATGLDGAWRLANTLLPAVDQHGNVTADPMTTRAISATIAFRQTPGEAARIKNSAAHTEATGRFKDATMNELADAYDDVDEQAAALLLRLKEIVGEGDDMLGHLKTFGL